MRPLLGERWGAPRTRTCVARTGHPPRRCLCMHPRIIQSSCPVPCELTGTGVRKKEALARASYADMCCSDRPPTTPTTVVDYDHDSDCYDDMNIIILFLRNYSILHRRLGSIFLRRKSQLTTQESAHNARISSQRRSQLTTQESAHNAEVSSQRKSQLTTQESAHTESRRNLEE